MASRMMMFFSLSALLVLAASEISEVTDALVADDQCDSEDCALSAIQLRGYKLEVEEADQRSDPALTAKGGACSTKTDVTLWKQKGGQPGLQTYLQKCALANGAAVEGTRNCLMKEQGYSFGCGTCFANLVQCTMKNCLTPEANCAANSDGPSCKYCTRSYCYGELEACSGLHVLKLTQMDAVEEGEPKHNAGVSRKTNVKQRTDLSTEEMANITSGINDTEVSVERLNGIVTGFWRRVNETENMIQESLGASFLEAEAHPKVGSRSTKGKLPPRDAIVQKKLKKVQASLDDLWMEITNLRRENDAAKDTIISHRRKLSLAEEESQTTPKPAEEAALPFPGYVQDLDFLGKIKDQINEIDGELTKIDKELGDTYKLTVRWVAAGKAGAPSAGSDDPAYTLPPSAPVASSVRTTTATPEEEEAEEDQ